ncbi:MAG: UpxY family transcription antiterminator [Bacteroidota bacterium]
MTSKMARKAEKKPINDLHPTESRWFAVHTRNKSEKFVKRMLEKKEITAYLPLQKIMRQYGRVRRLVDRPLINCYIFVNITKEKYLAVMETENVVNFARVGPNLMAVKEEEIKIIKRVTMEDDLEVDVVSTILSEGDPVEISAGSLIGMKGKIVKKDGKRKFQVELESLGMSMFITIDGAFLEKMGGAVSPG